MIFFFMRDFSVHTALHAMCNFLSLSQLIFISEKYYTIWRKIIALHAILRICSCRCENKEADQLHGEHAADQRFYFPFIKRIVSVLPILESSYSHFHHLQPSYMAEQTGLFRASRETSCTGSVLRWRNHKTGRFVNDLILLYYFMIGVPLYYLSDRHISADIANV